MYNAAVFSTKTIAAPLVLLTAINRMTRASVASPG